MAKKAKSIDLEDLHIQLKITNCLLAAGLKEKLQQTELIKLLETTGASASEIADVLNTTSGAVSVALSRMRKKPTKSQATEETT